MGGDAAADLQKNLKALLTQQFARLELPSRARSLATQARCFGAARANSTNFEARLAARGPALERLLGKVGRRGRLKGRLAPSPPSHKLNFRGMQQPARESDISSDATRRGRGGMF